MMRDQRKGETHMRYLAFALALMGIVTAAHAKDAIPDLKGSWSGKGKSIVFGNNAHHPGTQTMKDAPRVRDFEFTFVVDGQDGRLLWGHSFSSAATTNEPFAWRSLPTTSRSSAPIPTATTR